MPPDAEPPPAEPSGEGPLAEFCCIDTIDECSDFDPEVERRFELYADRVEVHNRVPAEYGASKAVFRLDELRGGSEETTIGSAPPWAAWVAVLTFPPAMIGVGLAVWGVPLEAPLIGAVRAEWCVLLWFAVAWTAVGVGSGLAPPGKTATILLRQGGPAFFLHASPHEVAALDAFLEKLQAGIDRAAASPTATPPEASAPEASPPDSPPLEVSTRKSAPEPIACFDMNDDLVDVRGYATLPQSYRLFADRVEVDFQWGPNAADRSTRVHPLADLRPPVPPPPPWSRTWRSVLQFWGASAAALVGLPLLSIPFVGPQGGFDFLGAGLLCWVFTSVMAGGFFAFFHGLFAAGRAVAGLPSEAETAWDKVRFESTKGEPLDVYFRVARRFEAGVFVVEVERRLPPTPPAESSDTT